MRDNKLVFFDLETSGLDAEAHAITEIAAVAVTVPDFQPVADGQFFRRIRFQPGRANSMALLVNSFGEGIENREELITLIERRQQNVPFHLRGKTEFLTDDERRPLMAHARLWNDRAHHPRSAVREFSEFLKRHATVSKISRAGKPYQVARLAGHNVTQFDLKFLQNWYTRLGEFMPADYFAVDTIQMALQLKVFMGIPYADLKLLTLCEYHGIATTQTHDALNDVFLAVALCAAMHHKFVFDNSISDNAPIDEAAAAAKNILSGLPEHLRQSQYRF